MTFEVERKFRVDDLDEFLRRIESSSAELGAPIRQVDEYFAHPARDFAATDEALRVRVTDGQCRVTYKGPKVGTATKTRREIELPFADSVTDPEPVRQLLLQLGFRSVAQVCKSRRSASLEQDGWRFSLDVDDVEQIGTFVELDTSAEEPQIEAAEKAMSALVARFGLSEEVRLSYLEMLLAQQAQQQ